jgi:hypothetical protein
MESLAFAWRGPCLVMLALRGEKVCKPSCGEKIYLPANPLSIKTLSSLAILFNDDSLSSDTLGAIDG